MKMTIYVHPGRNQCNVYAIDSSEVPCGGPRMVHEFDRDEWEHIGLLNYHLEVVWLDPEFQFIKEDLRDQMGGTYWEIDMNDRES